MKDQEVKDGDNFILSKDENKGIYKLTVKKYSAETTGELKFEASNASGKAESKGNLFLLRKSLFHKLRCLYHSLLFKKVLTQYTQCDSKKKQWRLSLKMI